MTQDVFSLDGRYFNIRIPKKGIKRSFSVTDSDKAGRVMTGAMKRDIIGTFYNYTIQCNTELMDDSEYDEFYELISAPDDCHVIIVPYGQSILTFEAYVTGGEDVMESRINGRNSWSGLSINFIAMKPQRVPR